MMSGNILPDGPTMIGCALVLIGIGASATILIQRAWPFIGECAKWIVSILW